MMQKLELIYINLEFKTMINFRIESKLTYDIAYKEYAVTEYIGYLLKHARETIKQFGATVELPSQFAKHMCDAELDYLLLLLEQDVDTLIDGHINIRLPTKHASTFTKINNGYEIWRANGMGLNTILLVNHGIDDQSLKFCLPTFTETNENFVIHR